MIVTCPNCTTRLQLDDAKIPTRAFSVRCPKCEQLINAPPPTQQNHKDALGAVGDLPEVARLLSALLRRGAGETVDAQVARRPVWERRRALLCVGSAQGDDAARALAENNFEVYLAADAPQAVERMREDVPDVLVLDAEFDTREQGALSMCREINSLRMPERRRLVFVQLSTTARTGDAHAAFLLNANLVVNSSEVKELPRALEKNLRDLNELYRNFNKALNVAEL
ncbi:MAG: zinc-ribbon domain-containing protein [Acidobacteria bacterium]|nr:zinc-ribbon domain-containing protein [Acidobacteriota bacterium]